MGYLITERFIHKNDLRAACVSLISHDRKVRTNTRGRFATVGHATVSLKRNAMSELGAGRIAGKSYGILGSGNCLDTKHSFIEVLYQLIDTGNDDDVLRTVKKRRNTVGVTVHIVKLTVFCYSVG